MEFKCNCFGENDCKKTFYSSRKYVCKNHLIKIHQVFPNKKFRKKIDKKIGQKRKKEKVLDSDLDIDKTDYRSLKKQKIDCEETGKFEKVDRTNQM